MPVLAFIEVAKKGKKNWERRGFRRAREGRASYSYPNISPAGQDGVWAFHSFFVGYLSDFF